MELDAQPPASGAHAQAALAGAEDAASASASLSAVTTGSPSPSPSPAAPSRSPTLVPQKRKEPPEERDFPPDTFPDRKAPAPGSPSSAANSSHPDKDEYETGLVVCNACGVGISFRDESTGTFTVKHWDAHRNQCPNASQQAVKAASHSPEPLTSMPLPARQAVPKKRRAKRTEDERIAYLRDDPYVAQFEAYRVLCASCDKWIRLRPNSTYCSIPWDAHRKSCLAKRVAKNSHPGDDRSILFSNDPCVRKFDSERVQCRNCEEWIPLGSGDNLAAVQKWHMHRTTCQPAVPGSVSSTANSPSMSSRPTIANVPPPSKHLMALVSSSTLQTPSTSTLARVQSSVPVPVQPTVSSMSFKDLTPGNFVPAQESRRRNAEQREAALRSDPLISEVQPNRVFCSICRKWVQLRQDSTYCAYPWVQHRGKCLNRHQRRLGKEPDTSGISTELQKMSETYAKSETGPEDDEDEDSEESGSTDDETRARRRALRREEKRKAKEQAWITRLKKEEEQRKVLHYQRPLPVAFADDEVKMDIKVELGHPARLADLETPAGRFDFVTKSVRYLFKTTYERSDDLTIATLVTYLNAAIPLDKHEDFDTTEVTKAAAAISDRGEFVLQGDVLRIRD